MASIKSFPKHIASIMLSIVSLLFVVAVTGLNLVQGQGGPDGPGGLTIPVPYKIADGYY